MSHPTKRFTRYRLPSTAERRKKLTLRLDEETHGRLVAAAASGKKSVNDYLAEIVSRHLDGDVPDVGKMCGLPCGCIQPHVCENIEGCAWQDDCPEGAS